MAFPDRHKVCPRKIDSRTPFPDTHRHVDGAPCRVGPSFPALPGAMPFPCACPQTFWATAHGHRPQQDLGCWGRRQPGPHVQAEPSVAPTTKDKTLLQLPFSPGPPGSFPLPRPGFPCSQQGPGSLLWGGGGLPAICHGWRADPRAHRWEPPLCRAALPRQRQSRAVQSTRLEKTYLSPAGDEGTQRRGMRVPEGEEWALLEGGKAHGAGPCTGKSAGPAWRPAAAWSWGLGAGLSSMVWHGRGKEPEERRVGTSLSPMCQALPYIQLCPAPQAWARPPGASAIPWQGRGKRSTAPRSTTCRLFNALICILFAYRQKAPAGASTPVLSRCRGRES